MLSRDNILCGFHVQLLAYSVLVLGMQDTLQIQKERSKAEEAQGFRNDAYGAIDSLELQVNNMASKMKKLATGLTFAISPNHEVSQDPIPATDWWNCQLTAVPL